MAINLSKNSTNFSPIGRKSRVVDLPVHNSKDPDSRYIVRVQANKRHGICDIILCKVVSKEVVYEYTDQKGKKHVKKKAKTYSKFVRRLSEINSDFQGRQFDNSNVMADLNNVLKQTL